MLSSRPQIAILVRRNYWSKPQLETLGNGSYHRSVPDIVAALRRAGGSSVVVEEGQPFDPAQFDGLVLPGGGDIHPSFYGEAVARGVDEQACDLRFDRFQIQATRRALHLERPILGICRGMQVLNVALGGTLVQDLPSAGAAIDHAPARVLADSRLRGEHIHSIEIAGNSQLAGWVGARRVQVNSLHHQAVARLGRSLKVSAWAEDGTVEAIEGERRWGVQFHPEDLGAHSPFQVLFDHLVEAAAGQIH